MYPELKNIYRSYIVTLIFTNTENMKSILSIFHTPKEYLDVVLSSAKEALQKANSANMEHFLSIFYFFFTYDFQLTLECCLQQNILKLCVEVVENDLIHKFIETLIFPPFCDEEIEASMAMAAIKSNFFKTLCDVIALTRRISDLLYAESKILLGDTSGSTPMAVSPNNGMLPPTTNTTCTEYCALSSLNLLFSICLSCVDSYLATKESYPHFQHDCEKHVILLDYFFEDECILLNCLFTVTRYNFLILGIS